MNILFISDVLPSFMEPNAGAKILAHQISVMRAQGHTVTLISITREGEVMGTLSSRVSEFYPIRFPTDYAARVKRKIKLIITAPRYAQLLLPQLITKVRELLIQNKYDAVYCSSPQMVRVLRLACKRRDNLLPITCKLILYTFDANIKIAARLWLELKQFHRHLSFTHFVNWMRLSIEELEDYAQADIILCASRSDQVFIRGIYPHKQVYFAPAWYDGFGLELHHAASHPKILYVGNSKDKRTLDALKWFTNGPLQRINAQVPSLCFRVLAGKPTPALRSMLANINVELADDTVLGQDLLDEYSSSTLVIAPLFQGGGIHVKLLTAIACGTPIVATSIANDGLEAVDGTSIYLADEADTFATRCLELISNPKKAEQMAMEAQRLIRRVYETDNLETLYSAIFKAS